MKLFRSCESLHMINIPEEVEQRYCAFKGISRDDFTISRADQDLIRIFEEYKEQLFFDEITDLDVADIGNATRYIIREHDRGETIYVYDDDNHTWMHFGPDDVETVYVENNRPQLPPSVSANDDLDETIYKGDNIPWIYAGVDDDTMFKSIII